MTSAPGRPRALGSRSEWIDEPGRAAAARAACEPAPTRAWCPPTARRRTRGRRTTRQTSVSPPIRCTFTFHTRGRELRDLARGRLAVQRFVHADGRAERPRQPTWAISSSGQAAVRCRAARLVQRAQVRLMPGHSYPPLASTVRGCGFPEGAASCAHRLSVPAGHLDLHTAVAWRGIVDPTLEGRRPSADPRRRRRNRVGGDGADRSARSAAIPGCRRRGPRGPTRRSRARLCTPLSPDRAASSSQVLLIFTGV